MTVASTRIRTLVDRAPDPDGAYVLHWMTAFRRLHSNAALEHAAARARALDRPLLVLEALSCGYPWANRRHHASVLAGMAEHRAALDRLSITSWSYVEPERGAQRGLLRALADSACLVVGDDWPGAPHSDLLAAAARELGTRLEVVDSCGLVPLRAPEKVFHRAVDFRRYLQKHLRGHLAEAPADDPLGDGRDLKGAVVPAEVARRWPEAPDALLRPPHEGLDRLPIDATVREVGRSSGRRAARQRLLGFVEHRLEDYADSRVDPDADAESGLSPDLHFGHLGSHEVLRAIADRYDWNPEVLPTGGRGKREGWWGLPHSAEAFLDQLVTWRELGHQFQARVPNAQDWESLPPWARETLDAHAGDPRVHMDEARLVDGHSGDPVWDAAQNQLREEGLLPGSLRMLWGKRVLEWSATPQTALARLFAWNDRYALDGRDPNSMSGITWCFGRFDRPWPERPVFGKVRSMSSERSRQKWQMERWLTRYASPSTGADWS